MKTDIAPAINLLDRSNLLKALGNETRLAILWVLMKGEQCVGDLAVYTNMSKSAISHQLAALRSAKIVKRRRVGKQIFYAIRDEKVKEFLTHIYSY